VSRGGGRLLEADEEPRRGSSAAGRWEALVGTAKGGGITKIGTAKTMRK